MTKTGRNDPCPCGSGKKYKKCCEAKEHAPKKLTAHKIEDEGLSNKVSNLSGLFQKMSFPQPAQLEEITKPTEESVSEPSEETKEVSPEETEKKEIPEETKPSDQDDSEKS